MRKLTTKQERRSAAMKMNRKGRTVMMREKAVKSKRDWCKEKRKSKSSKPWETKWVKR